MSFIGKLWVITVKFVTVKRWVTKRYMVLFGYLQFFYPQDERQLNYSDIIIKKKFIEKVQKYDKQNPFNIQYLSLLRRVKSLSKCCSTV